MTKLRELIQRLAGTWGKANFKTFDATVQTVDVDSRTCVVDSLDSSIIGLTVRFMLEVSDGDMNVPQEDSTVTVAMTDFTEPYIVSVTWIDNKLIIVGNQSIDVQPDKQIYNDGNYGGWATVKNSDVTNGGLLNRVNLLEERMNLMTSNWNSFANVYVPGSPSTTGLPASLATSLINPDLVKTTEEMISNPNITHGKKS